LNSLEIELLKGFWIGKKFENREFLIKVFIISS